MVKTKNRVLGILLSAVLVMTAFCFTAIDAAAAAGDTVYCQNDKGWSKVYCYMWTEGQGNNGAWPGEPMTDLGDGLWSYEMKGDYKMVIFNVGNNSAQTGDMTYPGNNALYNNSTGKWETYDPSPVVVKTISTDLASPQYTDTDIMISASAKSISGSEISYRISVTGTVTTILSDYSSSSTCRWTPASAGSYTITVDVMDAEGNTNSKSIPYEIKDSSDEVKPIIKKATPANGSYVETGTPAKITVTAGGGNTGTKLLFYKFTVKDPSGKVINIPYYTLSDTYSFTPTTTGNYTVDVSVQNSANTTVKKSFIYTATGEIIPTTVPPTTVVVPTTVPPTTVVVPTTAPSTAATDPTVAPTTQPQETTEPIEPATHPTTEPVEETTAPTTEPVEETTAPTTVPPTTVVVPTTAPSTEATDPTVIPSTAPTTQPQETTAPTTEPVEETTAPTTEPVEETTAPTTEPVEETTAPTTEPSTAPSTEPSTEPTTEQPGEPMMGDTDGDGKLSIKDATAIQRYIASILGDDDIVSKAADVDGDGKITIKDATEIQKKIAGYELNW